MKQLWERYKNWVCRADWHFYRVVENDGLWSYEECERCGQREARRVCYTLIGPVDMNWLGKEGKIVEAWGNHLQAKRDDE